MSASFDPKFIRFGKVAGGSTLLTNLISYYKFEEASGTLNDSVGTNHLSTISGTPTYRGAGKSNYGINIDAAGDAVTCLTSTGFLTTTGTSLSMWVNFNALPTTSGNVQFLFRTIHDGAPWFSFALDLEPVTNEWWFAVKDNASNEHSVLAAAPSTGSWYHVVCVAETGSPIRIYVNNSRTNSGDGNLANNLITADVEACIGNSSNGDPNGALAIIDELGFWSKALTDAEVAELYNSGNGKFHPFS